MMAVLLPPFGMMAIDLNDGDVSIHPSG